MSRWCLASCALVLALLTTTACKEEGGVKVDSFKFNGLHAVTDGQLRSVLATTPSSSLPWGTKHYFTREQFEADLKRIQAFYLDRGYPDAKVTSFDVQLSKDQSSVDITVNIDEGEPIRVQQIVLQGLEDLSPAVVELVRSSLPLKEGAPLDRALLQSSRETAIDALKEHGYPYASVRLAEKPGSADNQRVVTLDAAPGVLAHFGRLDIEGNSSVSDRTIRRQLAFRPGDLYQQSKVIESQRRLYTLELFQFANVKAETGEQTPLVPTRVTVTEGKHRKVNLGLGYGSEERARAQIDWRHVNFFGGARTAQLVARYSGLDRGVRVNFGEPYFFTRNYSLTLSAQSWHADEPAFILDTRGGQVTITRRFGPRRSRLRPASTYAPPTTLSFSYANELEDYSISNDTLLDLTQRDELIALGLDPRGFGGGRRSAVSLDAGRNTTGNLLNARKGYVTSLHLEQAGRWLAGDYDYYEVTVDGRYYQSLGSRAVVALRARVGSVDSLGGRPEELAVPFFKRYFLGGATNLRGWGRFDVSPLAGSGLPIGGQTVFNFSTELRVPVVGKVGAVLFLDGGNVWTDPWDFKFNDMRYDVGPGLRYDSPIGPLRVDLGYQLNPIDGLIVNGKPETRHFRVHFSIGQAF
jgi:outer membrane protein insertion porin family/translocation and assembly module TamA